MRILLTGSSGRIGRAIFGALAADNDIVGLDRSPFATTRLVADFSDPRVLRNAVAGVDAIVHTASVHAPHVGVVPDAEFHRINVQGTRALVAIAKEAGIRRMLYTSTTALYGDAVIPGQCTWIDESTTPEPKTIYHRTKLEAEALLADEAGADFSVTVIRMSRCFPEIAATMALHRLHRGIDARDVGDAHAAALSSPGKSFRRFVVSGWTPFLREDAAALAHSPREVLALRAPGLLSEFERRGWSLPITIDRVYDPRAAYEELGWRSTFGASEVFRQYDARDLEVLPMSSSIRDRVTE